MIFTTRRKKFLSFRNAFWLPKNHTIKKPRLALQQIGAFYLYDKLSHCIVVGGGIIGTLIWHNLQGELTMTITVNGLNNGLNQIKDLSTTTDYTVITMYGGNDNVYGGKYADTISGGAGNDSLVGNGGNDLIKGLAGNDTLIGGAGLDTLIGGAGADVLTGGADSDIFKFIALADSGITSKTRDTITDFKSFTDKIDLSVIDANEKITGDQAFTFIGTAAFNKTNASAQLRFDATSKILYGSTDADTAPEFSIQLNGVSSLVAMDFVL